jgi:hypothetical protein
MGHNVAVVVNSAAVISTGPESRCTSLTTTWLPTASVPRLLPEPPPGITDRDGDEGPRHQLRLQALLLGQTAVTQALGNTPAGREPSTRFHVSVDVPGWRLGGVPGAAPLLLLQLVDTGEIVFPPG